MEIVLRRYGNSTVAVFPPTVLKDLGLSAGQSMIMNTTEDGKIVLARKRKYILADLVAPVTQGGDFSRYAGFAVSLTGTGCKTQGVALINKIRMLDLTERQARKIERVPQEVLDDALGRLVALLDC